MRKPKSSDEEFWNQEPVTIQERPSRSSVLSLRMPTDEFHALVKAARAAGESVSVYVRKAIAMRVTAQPAQATVNVSYSSQESLEDWKTYTSGTEARVNTAIEQKS